MLTFRIAMTAAVMKFDHRDDQAVPPKIVTPEVNQITDFHWLPLPCSGEPAKPAELERRQSYGYGAALIR